MKEGSFKGVGGLNLFTRSWIPESKPKAILVISHGFNAHSGQYTWVAEQFLAQGYAVFALDHRGRGKSEGERYYVNSMQEYVDDLATFIGMAKSEVPSRPVFLLGHSAGGVIACTYCLDHQKEIEGLICEDFAYQVPAPDFALAVLKGLAHVAPHAHVTKLHNKDFSRDPKWVAMLDSDPLVKDEVQPTQTMAAMVIADDRLKKEFGIIKLPVLIIHGTEDHVTRPSGSQEFYDHAGSSDKTLKFYEGTYHDPLNDINKTEVLADIENWIGSHIPAVV